MGTIYLKGGEVKVLHQRTINFLLVGLRVTDFLHDRIISLYLLISDSFVNHHQDENCLFVEFLIQYHVDHKYYLTRFIFIWIQSFLKTHQEFHHLHPQIIEF